MDICTKMEGSAIQGIPFKYRIVSDRFMYENGSFSHPRHSITKQIIQRWIFVPKWQVWPTIAFHSWVFHSNTEQLVMDICTKMVGLAIQGIPSKYRIVSVRFMYENGRFSHPGHSITKQIIQRWIYVPKWWVQPSMVFYSNTEQLAMNLCMKMVGSAIQGIPFQYKIVSNGYIYTQWQVQPSMVFHSNTGWLAMDICIKWKVQPTRVFHSNTGWLAMDICTKVGLAIYGFPFHYRMVSDGYMHQNDKFIQIWFHIPIQDGQRWIYVPKWQVQPSMVFYSNTGQLAMNLCMKMVGSAIQGIPLQNRLFSDGYLYQNGRFGQLQLSILGYSIPIQNSQ